MKKQLVTIAVISAAFFSNVNAQQFFSGTVGTATAISRTGTTEFTGVTGLWGTTHMSQVIIGNSESLYKHVDVKFDANGLQMAAGGGYSQGENKLRIGQDLGQVTNFAGSIIVGESNFATNGAAEPGSSDLGVFAGGSKNLYLGGNKQIHMTFNTSGNVGIGTTVPTAKLHVGGSGNAIIEGTLTVGQTTQLATCPGNPTYNLKLLVNGRIGAKEVVVNPTGWCDYVFDANYKLRSLYEVEQYISKNKHLPEVPSEAQVMADGVQMGEMMQVHMKKIEELTLYMIELKKENAKLAAEMATLRK